MNVNWTGRWTVTRLRASARPQLVRKLSEASDGLYWPLDNSIGPSCEQNTNQQMLEVRKSRTVP